MQDKRICESIRILAVIVLLFTLIMTILSGKIPVQAAGAQLSVSSATAEKGDTVKVNVSLSGNPGIWGMVLQVGYDSNALQLVSMSNGGVFTSGVDYSVDTGKYVAMPQQIKDTTGNGTIVTLEFKVKSDASPSSYSVSAKAEQAINVSNSDVSVSSGSGKITVEKCIHSKSWVISTAATCETAGEQKYECSKCHEVFDTKTIAATGHQHTEVRNQVAASSTKEGYTGDTYCKDCGKKIASGKTIAKTAADTKKTDTKKTETSSKSTDTKSTTDNSKSDKKTTDSKTTDKKTSESAASEEEVTSEKETEATTEIATETEIETESEIVAETEKATKDDVKADNTSKDTVKKSSGAKKAVAVLVIVVGIGAIGALLYFFIIRKKPGGR